MFSGQARVVDVILANSEKNGININQTDNLGMTALMYACKEKEFYVISAFLRKARTMKVEFNLKDFKYGRTAFIWGCYHGKKSDSIHEDFELHAKRLKINLNLRDKSGKSGADYMRLSLKCGHYFKENNHAKGLKIEKQRYGRYLSGYFDSVEDTDSDIE